MNVFLVDDELLALQVMASKLRPFEYINVVQTFQDANEAIKQVKLQQPDVVFLDINMPQTSGLDAADQMLEHSPHTHIVFVTAYEEYAVEAFKLHALDYLLKPVSADRIKLTVDRIVKTKQTTPNKRKTEASSIQIRCFRKLTLLANDAQPIAWRTTKAKELFAFLLHHRHAVSKDLILDTLWQDVDLKKAHNQLYTTIYQIRQVLNQLDNPKTIRLKSQNGAYELIFDPLQTDYVTWETALNQSPPLSAETIQIHHDLFKQYKGDYLEEEGYFWAEGERERLRILWFDHALGLGEQVMQTKQYNVAVRLYLKLLDHFPLSEKVYFSIMKAYAYLGDRAAVERYYEELLAMLDQEFDMSPQEDTAKWYASYINNELHV